MRPVPDWKATALALGLAALASADRRLPASDGPHWRPNDPARGVRYVGAKECASCHKVKAASQLATPMALALASPGRCTILNAHPDLAYARGQYRYSIRRTGEQSLYSVTDGTRSLTVPVLYCFGKGEGGQTYVLSHDGRLYESYLSYYEEIGGLDVTLGQADRTPGSLLEAMGRELSETEARNCFGCHATNAVDGEKLQLDRMTEGVSCEACHGPGADHPPSNSGGAAGTHIFNPGRLTTEQLSDFCGTCHRTWEQVALMNLRGPGNVRFQPYRLANSKCYDREDGRISCLACHDPHQSRKREPAFYDARCQACHGREASPGPPRAGRAARRAPPCPAGTSNCASCHMPQYSIPGAHLRFHDHHIRVVKAGDAYPN